MSSRTTPLIWVNFVVQAIWMLLIVLILTGSLFHTGYLGILYFLLMPLGFSQIVLALILRFTEAPRKSWLNGYLLGVGIYFLALALLIYLDQQALIAPELVRYYLFPGSFVLTLYYWWYSIKIVRAPA